MLLDGMNYSSDGAGCKLRIDIQEIRMMYAIGYKNIEKLDIAGIKANKPKIAGLNEAQ